jgi:hypothetical protein
MGITQFLQGDFKIPVFFSEFFYSAHGQRMVGRTRGERRLPYVPAFASCVLSAVLRLSRERSMSSFSSFMSSKDLSRSANRLWSLRISVRRPLPISNANSMSIRTVLETVVDVQKVYQYSTLGRKHETLTNQHRLLYAQRSLLCGTTEQQRGYWSQFHRPLQSEKYLEYRLDHPLTTQVSQHCADEDMRPLTNLCNGTSP